MKTSGHKRDEVRAGIAQSVQRLATGVQPVASRESECPIPVAGKIFRTPPNRPWAPHSGYRVIPTVKWPGVALTAQTT